MILFFALGVLVFLLWKLSKNDNSSEPPTLPGKWPLLGHFLKFNLTVTSSNSIGMFKSMEVISKECQDLRGVAKFYTGPVLFYFITDPEDCLKVSTECLEKHYIYDFLKPVLANSILICDVQTWKKNRKLLNPAFSQHVLDGFIGIFNNFAKSLVQDFEKELGEPFDHENYIRMNNFETICSTSFGLKTEELGNIKYEFLSLLEEYLYIFNAAIIKFWYHIDFICNLTRMKQKRLKISEKINMYADMFQSDMVPIPYAGLIMDFISIAILSNSDDITKRLIMLTSVIFIDINAYVFPEKKKNCLERLAQILQKKKAEKKLNNSTQNSSVKLKPFMDLILDLADSNPDLTDEQINGETNTIVSGGHDTTASLLSFVLTVLGSHPRIQEEAYKEIIDVIGHSKEYIDKEDLSKFVYIEAILKETLRLYPSAPVVIRQIDRDIKLKNYTLKAGYGCMVCLHGAMRHPIWGPDATEYRPERWLEKESLPPPQLFAAFGLGRRSCIGKTYALMSMKITLVNIIKRFVVSSELDKMAIELKTMIRPAYGHHITLKLR